MTIIAMVAEEDVEEVRSFWPSWKSCGIVVDAVVVTPPMTARSGGGGGGTSNRESKGRMAL